VAIDRSRSLCVLLSSCHQSSSRVCVQRLPDGSLCIKCLSAHDNTTRPTEIRHRTLDKMVLLKTTVFALLAVACASAAVAANSTDVKSPLADVHQEKSDALSVKPGEYPPLCPRSLDLIYRLATTAIPITILTVVRSRSTATTHTLRRWSLPRSVFL